jgi:hypothetical protein
VDSETVDSATRESQSLGSRWIGAAAFREQWLFFGPERFVNDLAQKVTNAATNILAVISRLGSGASPSQASFRSCRGNQALSEQSVRRRPQPALAESLHQASARFSRSLQGIPGPAVEHNKQSLGT